MAAKRMAAKRVLILCGVFALVALGGCSLIPKPQHSVDPLAGEVKSTTSIPTNPPRRPLD
jgi:hypothetical protein